MVRPAAAVVSLSVEMTDSPRPVGAGGLLTYEIEVTNNGDEAAQNVVIETTVPDATSFFDADPNAALPGGNRVVWSIGSLAGGGQGTVTLRVDVDFPTVAEDHIVNAVEVTADNAPGVDAGVLTSIRPLGVDMSVSTAPPDCLGSLFRAYRIRYSNGALVPLTNLELSAEIPSDTTVLSRGGGAANCSLSPATACSSQSDCPAGESCMLSWDIGTLGSGDFDSHSFSVRVEPNDPPAGTTLDSFAVLTDGVDVGTDNAPTTTIQDLPCPGVEKIDLVAGSVEPGGRIRYLIRVKNSGRVTATGGLLEDPVLLGTDFATADPTPCGLDPNEPSGSLEGDNVVRWRNPPDLGPEEFFDVCLEFDVQAEFSGSSVLNTASFSFAEGSPVEDSASTPVQAVTALKLTKEASPSPFDLEADERLTYTIRLENVADFPVTGVVITDHLERDLTPADCARFDPNATAACGPHVPNDPNGIFIWDDPNDVLTWDIGSVAPDGDVAVCFVVSVDEACAGELLRNVAQVMDDRGERASAAATTRIRGPGDPPIPLRLVKEKPGQAKIEAGKEVVFTLRVQNRLVGQDLADVTVTDDLDAVTPSGALAFVSAASSECGGTGPDGSVDGNVVSWEFLPVLPPGEQTVCLRVKTSKQLKQSTLVLNTAKAADLSGNSAQDSIGTRVFAKALGLQILDEPDPLVDSNGQIRYTISVFNLGDQALETVVVKTRVPAGTTLDCLSGSAATGDCDDLGAGVVLARDPSVERGRRIIWTIEELGTTQGQDLQQMEMVVTLTKPRRTIRAVAKAKELTLGSKRRARALTVVEPE
jgi:uncharacterized repeat protein (TIGR01451 family)